MGSTTTNLAIYLPAVNDAADEDDWGNDLNTAINTLDSEIATKTVNQNFADKVLSRPVLKDVAETKQDVTATTSTTIDIESGNVVNLTHGTNISTLTISNWPASGSLGYLYILRAKDNSATTRTITWPGAVTWTAGGVEPSLTQSANAVDHIILWTIDGGTTIYGAFIPQ